MRLHIPISPGQRAAQIKAALAELAATDWLVIRATERGEPLPEDVRARREWLRAEVSRLRATDDE
jgi:hypothetical protein